MAAARATNDLPNIIISCSHTVGSTQLESMKRPTQAPRTRPVSSVDVAALAHGAS